MHEPGFDDDRPDMVDEHAEYCPCDQCCYPDPPVFTKEEMDEMWIYLPHSIRPTDPDELDLPF